MPRPKLPLEIQVKIEHAIKKFLATSPLAVLMTLRVSDLMVSVTDHPLHRPRSQPASVEVEIRDYASGLFDCEAQFYGSHAEDDGQLRSLLGGLAIEIEAEALKDIESPSRGGTYTSLDRHSTLASRKAAIAAELKERIEYWVKVTAADPAIIKARESARRGKLLGLNELRSAAQPPTLPAARSERTKTETMAEQIRGLRKECRMTIEQLASAVHLAPRNVRRHEAGESKIRDSNIEQYERVFSDKLKRPVRLKSS